MKRALAFIFLAFLPVLLTAQVKAPVKKRTVKQWNLSGDFTDEVVLPFDTLFSLFHRFRAADRYSPMNATLGNYGLPFYQINFFDRITDPDKFLYSNYLPFMFVPSKALFMNTQVPFTELVWTNGGPRETSEQTFRVRHSQNVNRMLNFGLDFNIIYNLGEYSYQKAENKTATLYSSYNGTKYQYYFSAGINNISSYENGGITGLDQLPLLETREVPVNMGGLNVAKSILKNRNLLLVQKYTVGRSASKRDSTSTGKEGFPGINGTFSHIFEWEANSKTFEDKYPAGSFFDTIYISDEKTFDSLYARSIKNTVRFDFATGTQAKFRLGVGVGIRSEIFRYSQIQPVAGPMIADLLRWNHSNNVLLGKVFNTIGDRFRWSAKGELFLTGYRAGDFIIDGVIKKEFAGKRGPSEWLITGGIQNREPSFWVSRWGGNNIRWNQSTKKEFRIDVGTSYNFPARNLQARFNYAIIDNYTDFGTDALPSQFEGGLSVMSALLSKDMRAWKFHLNNEVLLQKSSNREILDLPLVSLRSAGYFEHTFRFRETNGRLSTQLGAEVFYHTMYMPYNYMPATGKFYRQELTGAGNYPFVNVFLNLKIKRTRIFVMFDHINAGYSGYNYFMVPLYPANARMFRTGVAWTFYN